ncbi:hypothetical protein EUV02_11815 [Polymorphobacter arshaanensis]|uniref:Outer membrane protein beta-barrel domain-containing protein n=1 Tax=Glacieibacterium arshaanense TaxID=2511025 RepID=A0A4Y9EP16_9SPHN|nr:hypothetical protein [Polymorphobacter arshaanensis]TFU03816.1 hypothetical protein EUV02_11815 [Polymorphobacter arshaanensis]
MATTSGQTLRLAAIAWCALAATAQPLRAAGNAHIVDDSAVAAPGSCYVDSWYNRFGSDSGSVQITPGCTPASLPNVELSGYVVTGWQGGTSLTGIGLSPKFKLRDESTGLGIALSPSVAIGLDSGTIDFASLIVPVTIPASATIRLNVNAGLQWLRADDTYAGFFGGQIEVMALPNLMLMAEGFTRTIGKAGLQAGVRWTPGGGSVDIELLAGRYIDSFTPSSVTLGMTIRF